MLKVRILIAILFILCAVPIGLGLRNIWRAVASPSWPKTTGVVKTSETTLDSVRDERNRPSTTMYEAKITFQYEVNGRTYSTDTLHFGQIVGSGDSSDAELRRVRYPAGARVTISYDPKNPAVAAAEPGFDSEVLLLPGAGVSFALPLIIACVFVFGAPGSMDGMQLGFGLFAGVCCAVGALFLTIGLVNFSRAHASEHWPVTSGVIVYGQTDRRISAVTTSDGTYRVSSSSTDLVYQYDVGGKQHYSNVRRFGQLAAASGNWAGDIAKRYPLGQSVSVRYDPANPSLAVLEPGFDTECYWGPGAGGAFFLFGVAVFIVVSRL